jgi:hypothetical protein
VSGNDFLRGPIEKPEQATDYIQWGSTMNGYVRGCLRQEAWQTPGEWEAAYREELPAEALVWIRWRGDETWQPARWRDAKGFSAGVLEALVCRGYEEPPRPDRDQLKAEQRRTIGL